jgi:hypothetical protein
MTSAIGRFSGIQTFAVTGLFQVFWSLNFFLLISICVITKGKNSSPPFMPFFFDRYGTTFNYLFAAFFGISFIFVHRNQKFESQNPRK